MNERRTLSPPAIWKNQIFIRFNFSYRNIMCSALPVQPRSSIKRYRLPIATQCSSISGLGQSIQSCHLYLCSTPLTAIYSSHVGGQFPSPLGLHHWFIPLEELKMSTSHLLKVAYLLLFLFAWPNRQPILLMLFTV